MSVPRRETIMNPSEPTSEPPNADTLAEALPPAASIEPNEDWPPLPVSSTPLPNFPLAALPAPLREEAESRAGLCQVSPDAVILPMLTAIGTAAAKRVRIRVGRSLHPTHSWAFLPMASGEGKTPVLEQSTRSFHEAQRNWQEGTAADAWRRSVQIDVLRDEYKERFKELRVLRARPAESQDVEEQQRLEARLIGIKQQLDELKAPTPSRFLCEDTTPQALVQLLAGNQNPLLLASSEGSVLLNSACGSSVSGQHIEALLKAYSGEDIYVDRVSRPPLHVSSPVLGMILATQPVVVRELLRARVAAGRGLWERFLYAVPPTMVGRRKPVGLLDCDDTGYYDALVGSLLRQPSSDTPSRVLDFEPQAERLFDDCCLAVDRRMADGDFAIEPMRGWAAKMRMNLLRMSAVLHLASEGGEREDVVCTETVRNAISLMDVAVHHARYVLVALPEEDDDENYLIHQLQRDREPITRRDLFRRVQIRFRSVGLLNDTLDRMAAKGVIRVREERHLRGRPTHWVHLHPQLRPNGRGL